MPEEGDNMTAERPVNPIGEKFQKARNELETNGETIITMTPNEATGILIAGINSQIQRSGSAVNGHIDPGSVNFTEEGLLNIFGTGSVSLTIPERKVLGKRVTPKGPVQALVQATLVLDTGADDSLLPTEYNFKGRNRVSSAAILPVRAFLPKVDNPDFAKNINSAVKGELYSQLGLAIPAEDLSYGFRWNPKEDSIKVRITEKPSKVEAITTQPLIPRENTEPVVDTGFPEESDESEDYSRIQVSGPIPHSIDTGSSFEEQSDELLDAGRNQLAKVLAAKRDDLLGGFVNNPNADEAISIEPRTVEPDFDAGEPEEPEKAKEKTAEEVLQEFHDLRKKFNLAKTHESLLASTRAIKRLVQEDVFPVHEGEILDYNFRFSDNLALDLAKALEGSNDKEAKSLSEKVAEDNLMVKGSGILVYAELLRDLVDCRRDLITNAGSSSSNASFEQIARESIFSFGLPITVSPRGVIEKAMLLREGVTKPAIEYIDQLYELDTQEQVNGALTPQEQEEKNKAVRSIDVYRQNMELLGDESYLRMRKNFARLQGIVERYSNKLIIDHKDTGIVSTSGKSKNELFKMVFDIRGLVEEEEQGLLRIGKDSNGVLKYLANIEEDKLCERIAKYKPMDENIVALDKRKHMDSTNWEIHNSMSYRDAKRTVLEITRIPEGLRTDDQNELLERSAESIELYAEDVDNASLGVDMYVGKIQNIAVGEILRRGRINRMKPLWEEERKLKSLEVPVTPENRRRMAELREEIDRIQGEGEKEHPITIAELTRTTPQIRNENVRLLEFFETVKREGKRFLHASEAGSENLPIAELREDQWEYQMNEIINEVVESTGLKKANVRVAEVGNDWIKDDAKANVETLKIMGQIKDDELREELSILIQDLDYQNNKIIVKSFILRLIQQGVIKSSDARNLLKKLS
ncbi:MAG TPA: hypothetical protein VI819_03645 [Patescibacteria group bacterium]|nr:hypothetical protein [Patescibacteria group bacterium]